jgi:hypothetical protein
MSRRQGDVMKRKVGCLIALGFAGVAVAAEDTVKLLPTPLEMPRRIGPLVQSGEPHKYDPPALGVSYQYNGPGLSLTVYVYDGGETDIPDGGDTVLTCQQYENAKHEVMGAGYPHTTFKSEQLVRLDPPADLPLAREAVFEFEQQNEPVVSFLWATGVSKHFVKLRFSASGRLRDELPDARRAILAALGAAVKPHLAPVDPKADKPGVSIVVNSSGSPADMAAGFGYLISLSAMVDNSPGSAPVCGGEFVPDYAQELAAYQGMLQISSETHGGSAFEQRLREISAAGFLEEFVWTYRHRDSWGLAAPDGLTLEPFNKWRKKHLKRFKVPEFGRIDVQHPKPMPVEPAL